MRWAWAEVDREAITHNVATLGATVAPAAVWAVVKADGYGHGAAAAAGAAAAGGATGFCVALVQEGVELRAAGFAEPILILSQQPPEQADEVVRHRLTPTVYTFEAIEVLAAAASIVGTAELGVHLKLDTGMHRVGASIADAVALADAIAATNVLVLEGVFTHLACADEPTAVSNGLQLRRFEDALEALARAGHRPELVHAANSAAAIALPDSRHGLVRLGIAMYGIEPGPAVSGLCADLRPALSLHSRVGLVKRVAAGASISYGLRHTFTADTTVATIPIGYADGVPRRLFLTGGAVLIRGRRMPIVGVVTMDALMVDCGDTGVAVGDDVVLIGGQVGPLGSDAIPAEEWAARLGTIGYEIVCGISRRVPRI